MKSIIMNRGIEVLSPPSYLHNSNWLFQETKGAKWTAEENKRFENALALYDKDCPDRWERVAAMLPGKTVGDVMKQYRELEEDVSVIEAGLIPVPGYHSNYFTLEWVNSLGSDGLKQFCTVGCKRGACTRPSEHERRKGVLWTEEEHRQFLLGLKKYGKGDWRNISRNFVTTRTPTQVASHAQKYFNRQLTGPRDKRRSSIHDITMVNLPDTTSPSSESNRPASPDHRNKDVNPPQNQKFSAMIKQENDWKLTYEGMPMVFNTTNGNMAMSPIHGISPFGSKSQDQFLLRATLHGHQFGTYDSIFQMQPMHH